MALQSSLSPLHGELTHHFRTHPLVHSIELGGDVLHRAKTPLPGKGADCANDDTAIQIGGGGKGDFRFLPVSRRPPRSKSPEVVTSHAPGVFFTALVSHGASSCSLRPSPFLLLSAPISLICSRGRAFTFARCQCRERGGDRARLT